MARKTMLAEGITHQDFEYLWIKHSFDFPRDGLCYYKGELCAFLGYDVANPKYNPTCECEDCECENVYLARYAIFRLSTTQKIKALLQKWAFEIFVGTHCSYRNGMRRGHFYYRKPEWLFKGLFKLYYWWPYGKKK